MLVVIPAGACVSASPTDPIDTGGRSMKTYTFAPKDAPVAVHMHGLCKALEMWARNLERRDPLVADRAAESMHARAATYRDLISIIQDSYSIED